ncbi:MAG: sulfur oxidation c-type cytochrome SoxA [Methylococcaceae bacterium]|nr:sulfur oxidation c-type cytochrome SoxA [Methylococcaceae bacterium]
MIGIRARLKSRFQRNIQRRRDFSRARLLLLLFLVPALPLKADPLKDQQAFRTHYQKLFPQLSLKDYAEGIYAIDPISRESWLAIEEFPPYEPAIDKGKLLFETVFENEKSYADCFENGGIGIAQNYPLWDDNKNEVLTLAKAINDCRIKHQQSSLAYKKGEIAQILAYMAYTSRGQLINIKIPKDKPKALAAYQQGKDYYYQRRGQLNFSCASCHVQNAGKHIRSEFLSPALGHTSGWPTYRLKWGEMGTLHRRFIGCHKQIRAKSPKAQSTELRQLEYFLTFMGNGIPINAPSTRR